MARAELGHGVVADPREPFAGSPDAMSSSDGFGQRDDLPVLAQLVHRGESRVEIEQRHHPAQSRA